MKQAIITFILLVAFLIAVFTIQSNRIDKINNGEMILVEQNK